ncbi:NAD-dependent epimerase [Mucilaginibacter sp. cycad4]|uniref:NAD-dependent epimerase n=1 Tax=Mucilaginibacter sp. cycad4 TaxID=3342096 RepID=UPI002AABA6B7|nr:NAD-dependent epimerase [Mucilaginibacter gossypii]WPV00218.1 NAD-dependent epimerase [Mucilaginibacter gossypii]
MALKILVTGAAGFVGFHLIESLLKRNDVVVGIDSINDYYDPKLKFDRLLESGIGAEADNWNQEVVSTKNANYKFVRMQLEDKDHLMALCEKERFDVIVNLAAQAGVRYSIENPGAYMQSNLVGYLNVIEACRHFKVGHFVYASSSSVYGLNETMPFSVEHNVDHPVSLYAASKKANELIAHTYSHLYKIPTSGLRFFTVYGPWGRPDMAYFMFTDSILKGKPIKVFNHGKMKRDFTYIDDIVNGIINVMDQPAAPDSTWSGKNPNPARSTAPYRIFNIGNNNPVELMSFIETIQDAIGVKAVIEFQEMQAGDVTATWANVDDLINSFDYKPDTPVSEGIGKFVTWFKQYYKN